MVAKRETNKGFSLAEQVLEQIPTPVMAVDTDMKIIYMNLAGLELMGKDRGDIMGRQCSEVVNSTHCGTSDCCMRKAINEGICCSARQETIIKGTTVPVEYFTAPLRDEGGKIIGGLEYVLDITERVRHEERLREQARTIREISTPAIVLWDGIVILPVVGVIDSVRAQQMMETMLTKIAETACKVMILDIQGVPAVDTAVANHLIKIVKATRLMGCEPIISGISPAVAQTIVHLGIDMGAKTNATLREALAGAFESIHCEVRQTRAGKGGSGI